MDVITAVAKKAAFEHPVINTPWTGIFAALNNGDIDIIVGVTINDKRKQFPLVHAVALEARQFIAVPATSAVKSLKDLTGKKVGVVIGGRRRRHRIGHIWKDESQHPRFESTPVMIQELAAFDLDAAIGDNGVIAYRVQEQKKLKTVDDPSFPEGVLRYRREAGQQGAARQVERRTGRYQDRRHLRHDLPQAGSTRNRPCRRNERVSPLASQKYT